MNEDTSSIEDLLYGVWGRIKEHSANTSPSSEKAEQPTTKAYKNRHPYDPKKDDSEILILSQNVEGIWEIA